MKKFTTLAALAVFSLFSHAAHSAELLTNGSFESAVNLNAGGYCYQGFGDNCGPIQGWTGSTPAVIAQDSAPWSNPGSLPGFNASFGNQIAGVQTHPALGQSSLEQTVNGAGGLYTLSWYDAGRIGDGGQTYQVNFGGSTIGTFGVNSGQGWSLNSFTFTAAGGSQLLSFVGVGSQTDGTVFLDKVSLTGAPAVSPVPEPESLAMMLAGLGVLGGVARRQRKAV
ncbi:PEP-CTERM sorting domain-containing protein [uncultured Sphaerotilus sp.]|uniref:PEP-CTERM sorting domain-containing protein n=1 Tax=uncultured Sphaerotilus sp. TaxID=474984 RepID=UPI0030CA4B77